MARAYFYYQQKIDTSWYAQAVAVPDLSWLQQESHKSNSRLDLSSTQANVSTYVPVAELIDLSWMQLGGVYNARLRSTISSCADPSIYLPITEAVDISWLQVTGKLALAKTILGSREVSTTLFLSTTAPDVSWIQLGGDYRPRKREWYSKEVTVDWYLDPTVMLGLEWINTSKDIYRKHPTVVSSSRGIESFTSEMVANVTWLPRPMDFARRKVIYDSYIFQNSLFLPIVVPDLSWMQMRGVQGYRFGTNQAMDSVMFSNSGSSLADVSWQIHVSPMAMGKVMRASTSIVRNVRGQTNINRTVATNAER